MRNRRHTIDTPPPVDRVGTLSLLVVNEGSFLSPPSAVTIDLHLPASRGLPSWGVIGSALAIQAPGTFVASTRHVVVVMYAPGVQFITTLEEWEAARKTPFDAIKRLTVLRADAGLPLPSIPGAAEAYNQLGSVLCNARPSQPLALSINVDKQGNASPLSARPALPLFPGGFPGGADWQSIPIFAPLHERRGIDLPILHIPRGRRPPPQESVSTQSLQASVRTESTETSTANGSNANTGRGVQLMRAHATPLTGQTSWGNWFTWSP